MSKSCKQCGKQFEGKRMYCHKDCQNKAHSIRSTGKNNPNYNKDKDYKYNCETCGEEFISYSKLARFCSRSCNGSREDNRKRLASIASYAASLPRKKKESVKLGILSRCKTCGLEFRGDKKRTYCEQHSRVLRSKTGRCVNCGGAFTYPTKNVRLTCSKGCKSDSQTLRQKGDKSHLWEGGKTSEAMIVRNSKEYKLWRSSVFDRDDYTCVLCGQRGGKLNADHIKPFSTHKELRLELSNGRTLCAPCHLKTDTWGGNCKNKEEIGL